MRIWLCLALAIGFGTASAKDAASVKGREILGPSGLPRCAGISGSHECAKKIEKDEVAKSKGKVLRRESEIEIKLANGKSVTLKNTEGKWPHYVGYDKALKLHLIFNQFGEGSSVTVVSENGEMADLNAIPIANSNKLYFVVASSDFESGYNAHAIEIFEAKTFPPKKVFSVEPKEWDFYGLKWKSPTLLEFTRVCPNDMGIADRVCGKATIAKKEKDWQLKELPL